MQHMKQLFASEAQSRSR